MSLTVYRKAHFNAAHRLHRKDWTDEENFAFYGKCSNPNYHGHNYELEVGVGGKIDEKTGFLVDIKLLKKYIQEEVIEAFDHKNLNLEVPEFKTLNPTMENIAMVIWDKLRKRIDEEYTITIKLYETPRNFVVFNGR